MDLEAATKGQGLGRKSAEGMTMREEIFEGKTEEEALLKASEVLGVNITDMEYEVIEQETGLFGLFKKSVKIRVRVPDNVPGLVYRERRTETSEGTATAAQESRPEEGPDKAEQAKTAVEGILARMGIEARVFATATPEAVEVNIETDEADTIIGREGDVLGALQFIVNKIVNREAEGRKRVVVDVGGFRDRRAQELTKTAERLGDKAARTGRVIRLSGLSAQDRRIIHMALKDRKDVQTKSEGEGIYRCLLITPTATRRRKGTSRRRPRVQRQAESKGAQE